MNYLPPLRRSDGGDALSISGVVLSRSCLVARTASARCASVDDVGRAGDVVQSSETQRPALPARQEASDVDDVADRFKVVRVDAPLDSAQVVKGQTLRDRANERFVDCPVRPVTTAIAAANAVPILAEALLPQPAEASNFDFAPQPPQRIVFPEGSGARPAPAPVVTLAQAVGMNWTGTSRMVAHVE